MNKVAKFLKKRHYLPIKLLIVAITLVVCIVMGMGYFKGNVLPVVLTMSEATVKAMAVNAINNAAHTVIDESFNYEQLVNIITDNEKNIQMVQVNTLKINRLTRDLANMCQSNIEQIKETSIQLPLGAFTGTLVMSGMGPDINIALLPIGSVMCEFMSAFEEVGINQTRHSIYININTTISLVLPVSSLPVYTCATILVCDNIIVGKVPQVYFGGSSGDQILDLLPAG